MNKWGIWGLGTVGRSALQYLYKQGHTLSVYDSRVLTVQELLFLEKYQIALYTPNAREQFLKENDYILPSPGVDTTSAQQYAHKMIPELDLFCKNWPKELIAITGSLGKTTLVSVMDQILKANKISCVTGGNIGTPMLDLLSKQREVEYAMLELSSFQLEKAKHCTPSLAVLTNLYPNHLDRHGTFENYLDVKYQMFKHHLLDQKTLIPLNMIEEFRRRTPYPMAFFSEKFPSEEEMEQLVLDDIVYLLEHHKLKKLIFDREDGGLTIGIYTLASSTLAHLSPLLPETRLQVLAMSDQLDIDIESATFIPKPLELPEHRLEYVGTHNGRSFYNDSKATIIEATLAAATTLKEPTHLILGGLSKGVDRTNDITLLKDSVRSVHCFGDEAEQLYTACQAAGISATAHESLELAVKAAYSASKKDEAILLSPGGTSYDLYTNYKERGAHFKELVNKLPFIEKESP